MFRFVEFERAEAAVKAINILNAKFFHGFALKVAACHESSFVSNNCSKYLIKFGALCICNVLLFVDC